MALAVIDTNAWLDLYVFEDPGAHALAQALREGTLGAVRSARTDAELDAVLRRPPIAARCDAARQQVLLQAWRLLAAPVEQTRAAPWHCRDADDQKFLDLAFSAAAALLFTKDRALLDLARRTRRDGLEILPPARYATVASEGACAGPGG